MRSSSSLLLLVVLLFLGCDHKEEAASDDLEREEQLKAKVSEMVSKCNANDSWGEGLTKLDSLNLPLTTLHLQRAFPETSGCPFLFHVQFDDVFIRDGRYYAGFVTSMFSEYSISFPYAIYFELSCAEKQVQELLRVEKSDWFANLAIVAKVDRVRKLRFNFEAIADCYEEGYEEAYIEIEPSRVFLMKGELVDFCQLQ